MIKEIRYTEHALDRISKYYIDEMFVRKVLEEGEKLEIGKRKVKFSLRSKNKRWIVICGRIECGYLVITVIRGRV